MSISSLFLTVCSRLAAIRTAVRSRRQLEQLSGRELADFELPSSDRTASTLLARASR
jgi:uncharacterized protein YjiS (DUF1127 family)